VGALLVIPHFLAAGVISAFCQQISGFSESCGSTGKSEFLTKYKLFERKKRAMLKRSRYRIRDIYFPAPSTVMHDLYPTWHLNVENHKAARRALYAARAQLN